MENEKAWKELRRELRLTRVFCIFNVLLTIGLFVAIIFILNRMQPLVGYVEETQPVLENLAKLDVAAMNKTVKKLEDVDFKALADAVDALDMDGVNTILEQLSVTLKDVDVDALITTVQNLSESVQTLQALSNKWGGFLGFTG